MRYIVGSCSGQKLGLACYKSFFTDQFGTLTRKKNTITQIVLLSLNKNCYDNLCTVLCVHYYLITTTPSTFALATSLSAIVRHPASNDTKIVLNRRVKQWIVWEHLFCRNMYLFASQCSRQYGQYWWKLILSLQQHESQVPARINMKIMVKI